MINLLRHKPYLELLGTSEPDQQQALLETASAEQVHCLCLCAENVMKRKYLMPKHVMKKLRPYKNEMLRLADRGKCGRRKKRILVQRGEGFLGLLLSPILESLAELV
ncbi:Hypothetical predicted protein [Paramuricea clavata]|uniref:Uncharacterized protein n=1 Tax=Paramuricea clavata TaxID=317549 RepID=A0A7D9EG85_PARCT|nr:Hypothetical predicted protein [Paramuricea clavata]